MKVIQEIEFQNIRFQKVFYSNNNIYGKIMFTIDSNDKMRIHLIKDLEENDKIMNEEYWSNFIQTKSLCLKYEI